MHRPRPSHSLLSLLVALGLVLAPLSAHAGGPRPAKAPAKPLSPTSQKKVNDAFAGQKATKAEKAKAMTSLSSAMAKRADLRRSPNKQAAYVKASVTNQRGAASRTPTTSTKATRKKGAAAKARVKTKTKNKAKNKNKNRKNNAGGAADDDGALEELDAEEGDDGEELDELDADEVQEIIDNAGFDEANVSDAFDARDEADALEAEGRTLEALEQYIFYHDMMAYEAELAAQDYDAAGRDGEAESIRSFSRMSTKESTALKGRYLKILREQNAASQDAPDSDAPQAVFEEGPRAARAEGMFARMKANRAARKVFRQMLKEDGGMAGRYGRLNSEKRSWKSGLFTGLSAAALLKTGGLIIAGTAGVATFVFAGLATMGLVSAGAREFKVRDASRKQMVRELYEATQNDPSNPQLDASEIATYQAAGWI